MGVGEPKISVSMLLTWEPEQLGFRNYDYDRAPKALSMMSEGYSLVQSPFGRDLSSFTPPPPVTLPFPGNPPLHFRSRRKRKEKEENIFFVW